MRCDLAVVGGGVLGIAHAVAALRRGLSVALVERTPVPLGASVRNFGMIWPIGQARGGRRELAMRSAASWTALAAEAGFRCDGVGSLHVAYHDDEWDVLREYTQASAPDERLVLWDPETCVANAPGTVPAGLRGGLYSPHERSVDPPHALERLGAWLGANGLHRVAPDVAVEVGPGRVLTAGGRTIEAARVAICAGSDFETLCPEAFRATFSKCKLQMLATVPQPGGFALGPMRAAGLTLLHYPAFAACPSLERVRERLHRELPRHRAHGVHVLAAQHRDGDVILGDSHEYGLAFDPNLRADVERLILDYLATFLRLPDPRIARRWAGVYAVRNEPSDEFEIPIADGVAAVNGVAGAGMTLSMAIGARHVDRWFVRR